MSDGRKAHQSYRMGAQVRDPGGRRAGEATDREEPFMQLRLFEGCLDGSVDPDAWAPEPLELVVDTERDQVGVVVGRDAGTGRITLRPPEGGRVWHPSKCRRANAMDRLRARVIQQNREGRRW
ncbi:hypothetical protein [Streptomyces mobaraensis]|nr:hypothetical protein [Streptomyces mobaraensis]